MGLAPKILFEDNHLLVLNKPALLPTMGVTADQPSLLEWARAYIKEKYKKPGNVYLGIVSRLDAHATGAIVIARTSKAAARLTEQFRSSEVTKLYWALVSPPPQPASGDWIDYLQKDENQQRMISVPSTTTGAQRARLRYRVRSQHNRRAFLEVQLETGRKHQIRVQCASRGSPIIGDRKYGSPLSFPRGLALHAYSLALTHPTRLERLEFVAPPPEAWIEFANESGIELYS